MVYKVSSILALAACFALTVNGQKQIQGITSGYLSKTFDASFNLPHGALGQVPVSNLNSPLFTCRTNGFTFPDVKSYNASPGEMLLVKWDNSSPVLASSGSANITGPCNFYMASTAAGTDKLSWFRIAEQGYETERGWCTDIIKTTGSLVVSIPDNLKGGDYLFRTEVIDLAYADKTATQDPSRGAQFYADCLKFNIPGNTNGIIPSTNLVSFPGAYKETDPSLVLTLGADGKPTGGKYTVPGPALYSQKP
ncbi:hypothetical protein GGI04_004897 [Coemansia thaxteri]|uniref:AA9 family lytic polysaccharide monooxygenase n=1 Tax=Coemansia thaxteri TaxID=2663907 RepID=A0A9W8BDL8_9FUNG|nr:hypothetical protein GGI04_004897 [Coemansia thaxteri]KAJ2003693.1 hypothetical protein H4R26_002935 [Coemansia thaxteri]KAJ2470706.1 hypothetical protein GGI02_002752 [Coemansia sp. RSA 2322]KAJ2483461.1 hypothetical protein EV174_002933 [Coemansia sp. RSA 2320]